MISSSSSWITTQMEVLSATTQSIMFTKGPVITVLTNVGSPVSLRRRSERHLIAHCFFLARERHHLGQYRYESQHSNHRVRFVRVHARLIRQCSPAADHSILSCTQFVIGSGGTLEVGYVKGGKPAVIVPDALLSGSGICGHTLTTTTSSTGSTQESSSSNGAQSRRLRSMYISTVYSTVVSAILLRIWTWAL